MSLQMEPDLQVVVKGVSDEKKAHDIGIAVAGSIRGFIKADAAFDLRRMHRIVIASDFPGELAELSKQTASGNTITHTDESYATAVAKVLLFPHGTEHEIVPVFNAHFIVQLTGTPGSEAFDWILHLLHHELCHVHDNNKKLDAIPNVWLHHRCTGKDKFILPLAEACWSEYIANRMSSLTATDASVCAMADSLTDAIERTKSEIDREILSYRYHGDLEKLLALFQRHGEFLAKAAAYVLGYVDGLGKPLEDLSPKTAERLLGSYFEQTWNAMRDTLRGMHRIYPNGWKDLSVYDQLSQVLENYYTQMGLILSTAEDGRAYVRVPFRPETTPGLNFRMP